MHGLCIMGHTHVLAQCCCCCQGLIQMPQLREGGKIQRCTVLLTYDRPAPVPLVGKCLMLGCRSATSGPQIYVWRQHGCWEAWQSCRTTPPWLPWYVRQCCSLPKCLQHVQQLCGSASTKLDHYCLTPCGHELMWTLHSAACKLHKTACETPLNPHVKLR